MLRYQEAQETLSGIRFTVTYLLHGEETVARDNAESICVEQTIEFPADLLPDNDYWNQVKGQLIDFQQVDSGQFLATISYAIETISPDLLQLLNVIYGNISMIRNIRVMDVDLPDEVLAYFSGPRFGLDGVRERLGVYGRPMLCATIKPMGLSIDTMAEIAYQTALGGVDFVKDDHGLTDQAFAKFKTRVSRCAEVVLDANSKIGGHCLYTPNITAPIDQILDRAFFAKEAGAGAFMIIPALVGWDVVRMISENDELDMPVISHPSFGGIYSISTQGGIAAKFQYGMLPRLAGSDVSIFPNYVGRLFSTKQECIDVVQTATKKMGQIKPYLPSPGGGITLKTIADMNEFYGEDVVYIMGGGLHRGGTLVDNCKKFISLVSK